MPLVPNLLPQLALVALVPHAGAHLAERLMLLGYVLAVSFAMVAGTAAGAMRYNGSCVLRR